MPIEFPCPICHQQVRTPDAAAGKKGKCPGCGTVVMIPAPVVVAPPQSSAPRQSLESTLSTRPPDPARMPPGLAAQPSVSDARAIPAGPIEFPCPECGQTVRTPASTAGKKGQCPQCKAVVQIPGRGQESAARGQEPGVRSHVGDQAVGNALRGVPDVPSGEQPAPKREPPSKKEPAPKPAVADISAATSKPAPPAKPATPAAAVSPSPSAKKPVARALPTAKPIPAPSASAKSAPAKSSSKPGAKGDAEIIDLEELPAEQPGLTPGLTPLGSGLTPLVSGLTPLGPAPGAPPQPAPFGGLTPLPPGAASYGGGLVPLGPSGLTPLGPAPAPPAAHDPFAGLTPLSAYPAVAPPPPTNPLGLPASPYGGSANPYAAPALGSYTQPAYRSVSDAHRRGLPWEKDPSMEAFNETMSLVLGSPQEAFSQMRRTGGLGNPIGFMIIGMVIGQIATSIYGIIFSFLRAAAGELPMNVEMLVIGGAIQLVSGVVGAVIIAPIMTFVMAGLYHLLLAMVGGANAGYEATYRCVCFVNGSTSILLAIPCIGPLLAFFFSIFCLIYALTNAHETSGGKAAFSVLGVLAGMLICGCACGIMFIFPAIAAAMNQMP